MPDRGQRCAQLSSRHLSSGIALIGSALIAIWVGAPRDALAAISVTERQGEMQVQLTSASLAEVLDALSKSKRLTYTVSGKNNYSRTGVYSGTMEEVLKRVLDGTDYVMTVSGGSVAVNVFRASQPIVLKSDNSAPAQSSNGSDSPAPKAPPLSTYLENQSEVPSATPPPSLSPAEPPSLDTFLSKDNVPNSATSISPYDRSGFRSSGS